MIATLENPICYTDSFGDSYKFYIFKDRSGNSHLSITVVYSDFERGNQMLGYKKNTKWNAGVKPYSTFGLPLNGTIINWHAYDNSGYEREKLVSPEAKKFADRMFRLVAFL